MYPAKQIRLGKSFGEDNWGNPTTAVNAMQAIAEDKFAQIKYLHAVLKSTGEKSLVEANPYDDLWGAGCSARDSIRNDNGG